MPPAALPHAYPFRFVDTVVEERNADFSRGSVRIRVTGDARASMGGDWQSTVLYAEAIAQAALLLEGGDPDLGRTGFLAGIENFTAERAAQAGETLEISVRLSARFGPVVRFDGVVKSGDEILARASVMVRKGEAAAGNA
jgi:3-hydroxymyristoyl/3-hydroxydecanoyl-(acyl carrier protein) dehydratase